MSLFSPNWRKLLAKATMLTWYVEYFQDDDVHFPTIGFEYSTGFASKKMANRFAKRLRKLGFDATVRKWDQPAIRVGDRFYFPHDRGFCKTHGIVGMMWGRDDTLVCRQCKEPVTRLSDLSLKEVMKRVRSSEKLAKAA